MLDSPQSYVHLPAGARAGGGSAPDGDHRGGMPVPSMLLRAALRDLRTLDLERRRSVFATSGAGLADVPARDHDDAGLAPDRRVGLLAQLRAATTVHVRALHAAGEPPERVIAQVKRTMDLAFVQEGWCDPTAIEGLMRRVVRWSIVAYYDA